MYPKEGEARHMKIETPGQEKGVSNWSLPPSAVEDSVSRSWRNYKRRFFWAISGGAMKGATSCHFCSDMKKRERQAWSQDVTVHDCPVVRGKLDWLGANSPLNAETTSPKEWRNVSQAKQGKGGPSASLFVGGATRRVQRGELGAEGY